jgi:hypothetical protein
MLRRLIILLTFLAYQINLVHSILPHHHHDDVTAVVSQSHEHQDEDPHHHHEGEQEQSDNDFSLAHLIAEVAHNPSSTLVIHNSTSENTQKTKPVVDLLAFSVSVLLLPDDRPSLERSHYREVDYPSRYTSTAPLRGPPVV